MIKMTMNFNYKIPNIDLSNELEVVGSDFANILKDNISREIDLTEKPYAPLSPKTIAYKMKKGLILKILQATGTLYASIVSQQKSKNKVVVYIKGDRAEVGDILQNKGVRGGRKFNFFGISTKMEKHALDYMTKSIKEKLHG